MLQLTAEEADRLRSQCVSSKLGRGGRRYLPYAFTEQGVARLSSVLRSQRAVGVNIEIMRAFVRLRRLLSENAELAGLTNSRSVMTPNSRWSSTRSASLWRHLRDPLNKSASA